MPSGPRPNRIGARRALRRFDRCRREDMLTPEVLAALDFLAEQAKEKWPFDQFRGELDNDGTQGWEIEGRYQVLNPS